MSYKTLSGLQREKIEEEYNELMKLIAHLKDILSSATLVYDIIKEELLEIIKEIRIKLPDELKQAKWVKEERQRILAEAQKEADGIVKEAENRIISMIDEHEITRKAYEQKAEIIETANEMSREISQGTKEYANNLLNSTEKVLTDSLAKLEKDISEAANIMQMSLEGTIKTIQDSKKELQ